MSSPIPVLLLLRAESPEHADRAWKRMLNWEPKWMPSALDAQINEALRLTATGADPSERSVYDGPSPTERDRARDSALEDFKRRYSRRGP